MKRPSIVCAVIGLMSALLSQTNLCAQPEKTEDDAPGFQLKSREVGGSSFDWAGEGEYVDKDATTDGLMRIRELEQKARDTIGQLIVERDNRRIPAMERDTLRGTSIRLAADNTRAQVAKVNSANEIQSITQKMGMLPGDQRAALQQRIVDLEVFIRNQDSIQNRNLSEMNRLAPLIEARENVLKPIEDHMRQLWNEMEETRMQWLDIRDPTAKYARGDYEALRKVLDDWLLIDGLWPEAYFWAALCSYELQDYTKAVASLDKADKIRTDQLGLAREWPEVLALRFLIGRKSPPHRGRTSDYMKTAERINDKAPTAFMYFLIASSRLEREQDHVRAKKDFERALVQDSKYVCAEVALARLQTTSHNKDVADLDAGLATLERVWNKTGKTSWRLAGYLADAYDNAGQRDKAIEQWEMILASSADETAKQQAKARITGTGSAIVNKGAKPEAVKAQPASSQPANPQAAKQPATKQPSVKPPEDKGQVKVPAKPAAASISSKTLGEQRTWKGANGKEFKGALGAMNITLVRPDGTAITTTIDKLSEADKNYIRQMIK